eukprot:TRINITY_DN24761_c0_g1_i1.p1 TRINITY_DN24761_c0_g1~~TRINITY_DN24761_c0_g1_i1.p1  ORF type:complete len:326 (+),score=64.28 TRINITY_DN24761_c0_g1_i1:221-1198(+)
MSTMSQSNILTADFMQPTMPLTQPLMMMQPQPMMPVAYVPVMSGLGGNNAATGFAGLQLGHVSNQSSPFGQGVVGQTALQQQLYSPGLGGLVQVPVSMPISVAPQAATNTAQTVVDPMKRPPYVIRPGAWVDGRNLIVTGLPLSMEEEGLRLLFAPFGAVSRVHVVMDKEAGKSRGFGFVEFHAADNARKALMQSGKLAPPPTADNPIPAPVVMNYGRRSSEHRKSNSVYIGGFGKELGIAELLKLCKEYGEIRSGKVLDNRKHSDGVAFIRFASTDDADHACQALDGSDVMCSSGKICNLRVRLPDEVGKAVQRYGATIERKAG